MKSILTAQEVLAEVRSAFPQHEVGADLYDYDARIRFQVRDKTTKSILCDVPELVVADAHKPGDLAVILTEIRRRVEQRAAGNDTV